MPKFKDLSGLTFGRWKVLSRTANRGLDTMYECVCACGTKKIVSSSSLRSGMSNSCGCLHKEIVQRQQQPDDQVGLSYLRGALRFRAKRSGVACTLSDAQIDKLSTGRCFYCNVEPKQVLRIRRMRNRKNHYVPIAPYNGIDRVNPRVGYLPENSVSCCWDCNQMKGRYGVIEFIDRASKIIAGLRRFNHSGPA
jgi:hypothetical protein